jgi:hypothetical protein
VGATGHQIDRRLIIHDRGNKRNSFLLTLVGGGWQRGLAMVGDISAPRRSVVELPDGSSDEVRGKAESSSSSDALQPKERTRVATEWHGGV